MHRLGVLLAISDQSSRGLQNEIVIMQVMQQLCKIMQK